MHACVAWPTLRADPQGGCVGCQDGSEDLGGAEQATGEQKRLGLLRPLHAPLANKLVLRHQAVLLLRAAQRA